MSIHYLVHDKEGRIVKSGMCPANMLGLQAFAADQYPVLIGGAVDEELHWFNKETQEILLRPEMPVSVEGTWLKGVPENAQVEIEGEVYTADGTPIEVETSVPGIYSIAIRLFPYRDTVVEVTT